MRIPKKVVCCRETIDGRAASDWIASALAELAAMPNVVLLRRATVFGYYDDNYLTVVERRTDHLGPAAARELSRQPKSNF